jgi:hypothetical protein
MWKHLIKGRGQGRGADSPKRAAASTTEWHAVSIVSTAPRCALATGLLDVRFLSKDAPHLPLKGCPTAGKCRCSYQHHVDRRISPRRTQDLWSPGRAGYAGEERRRQRGRRQGDHA